jgi:hypothetical protein
VRTVKTGELAPQSRGLAPAEFPGESARQPPRLIPGRGPGNRKSREIGANSRGIDPLLLVLPHSRPSTPPFTPSAGLPH